LIPVEVAALDDFVREQQIKKIDFIKMDIEGAESEALEGAVNTLTQHRPRLAISIYHKKQDIILIPLFLARILKGYTYRLGHYTPGFCETTWYGIPHQKAQE
jgi:hypothetical protein